VCVYCVCVVEEREGKKGEEGGKKEEKREGVFSYPMTHERK